MTVDYLIVCEDADVGPDGRYAIKGVIDHLTLPRMPYTVPALVVAIRVRGEPGEAAGATLVVAREGQRDVPGMAWPLTVGPHGATPMSTEVIETVFSVPGVYHFALVSGGEILAVQPVLVSLAAPGSPRVQ